ncbi:MAG: CHAT domain-containing protein [Bacteroidota bacterium]
MTALPRPTIFLAFANDRENPDRFLAELEPERTSLYRFMSEYQQQGVGQFYPAGSGDPVEIIKDLTKTKGQLVMFHFSGHANGTQLQLSTLEGEDVRLHTSNLAQLLQEEEHLKLVFLNACATRGHVESLLAIGVEAIIATDRKISDRQALSFSETFYHGMVQGDSLQQAFQRAKTSILPGTGHSMMFRSLELEEEEFEAIPFDEIPWGLYHQNEHILDWRLTEEDFMEDRLRAGTQQFHEQLRNPGGKYASLNISDFLLGGVDSQHKSQGLIDNEVLYKGQELGKKETVQQLWGEEIHHSLVLGAGGTGKTVSLLSLWEQFLEEPGPIPLFISLNEYNQASLTEREHFLEWYICRYYLAQRDFQPELIQRLWNWLNLQAQDRSYPRILLMLDGFNEITADQQPLLRDLNQQWKDHPQVQILLTSREEAQLNWTKDFQVIELQGLDQDDIRNFLAQSGQAMPTDPRILPLLENPMMLTLFTSSAQLTNRHQGDVRFEFRSVVSSPGELLWNFLESQVATLAFQRGEQVKEFEVIHFFLKHYLPFLAYEMERQGLFQFTPAQMEAAMDQASAYFLPETFFYHHRRYRKAATLLQIQTHQDPMEDMERKEDLTYLLTNTYKFLKVEQVDEAQNPVFFAFLHQNFRDFFAVLHIRNQTSLDLAGQRPPRLLSGRPFPIHLRQMWGEVEGEHHHRPTLIKGAFEWSLPPQVPNLLSEILTAYRNHQWSGYGLWNVINTMLTIRGELSGLALDGLTLVDSGISFNKIQISRPAGKISPIPTEDAESLVAAPRFGKSLSISLAHTQLSFDQFDTFGHSQSVEQIAVSPDGARFLTFSSKEEGHPRLWSTAGGVFLGYVPHPGHQMVFHPTEPKVAMIDYFASKVSVLDLETKQVINRFDMPDELAVSYLAYHPNGQEFTVLAADRLFHWRNERDGQSTLTINQPLPQGKFFNRMGYHPEFGFLLLATSYPESPALIGWPSVSVVPLGNTRRVDYFLPKDCKWDPYLPQQVFFHPKRSVFGVLLMRESKEEPMFVEYQAGRREPILQTRISSEPKEFRYSEEGRLIISIHIQSSLEEGIGELRLEIRDLEIGNGKLVNQELISGVPFHHHAKVRLTPDLSKLLMLDDDGSIYVYAVLTGTLLFEIASRRPMVYGLRFGQRPVMLFATSDDDPRQDVIKCWSWIEGRCKQILTLDNERITCLLDLTEGEHLLVGTAAGRLYLWEWETASLLNTWSLPANTGGIVSILSAPEAGLPLICGTRNGQIWELFLDQAQLLPYDGKLYSNEALLNLIPLKVPSSDFLSFHEDGSFYLWSRTSKTWQQSLRLPIEWMRPDADPHDPWSQLALYTDHAGNSISPNGEAFYFVSHSYDEELGYVLAKLDLDSLAFDIVLTDYANITALGLNSQGNRAAIGSYGDIALMDTTQIPWQKIGEELPTAKTEKCTAVEFVPGSEDLFFTASEAGIIQAWSFGQRSNLHTWPNIPGLWVQGLDLTTVHWRPALTQVESEILRLYGAELAEQ